MSPISRRQLLTWFAVAPSLPQFLVRSAEAASAQAVPALDGRIVVVVRMLGGNDGLNTVVPIRDDRYYRARPTIALAARDTIAMPGGDVGLNPWLDDFRRLVDDGCAGIVQGVGYPRSSRSHSRSTEIFETASLADPAPAHGWLGRYLDHACECAREPAAGVQFSEALGRTLTSASASARAIGHPDLLLQMDLQGRAGSSSRGARAGRLDYLRQVENSLADASRQLHRAVRGSSSASSYPDTPFGQSLRWTGDMIETGGPTRVYYVTIGSFDGGAASFDTHVDQLPKHKELFSELGGGLRAFADHMRRAGQLDRVLLLTFSDFGRQLPENRTAGTEHGDASVMFFMGGSVRAGLLGQSPDLGKVKDGGLEATVDFRHVYADVLRNWLGVAPADILGNGVTPFPIVAA